MATAAVGSINRQSLLARYRQVRAASIAMCRPLDAEMFRIQPMNDVSPPWWNLGHTSWFYVRNVLGPFGGRREPADADLDGLLNSYYVSLGPRLARARRGLLTRPTTPEIYAYRASVDARMEELIATLADDRLDELTQVLTIGLNHEQQHQELFYTEIKYILAQNPRHLRRAYRPRLAEEPSAGEPRGTRFLEFEGGLSEFGYAGTDWCWDNELPRHQYYLAPFAVRDRLVTNGEYREFVDDGGYQQQLLWLDNGWNCAQDEAWQAPLYWEQEDGQWWLWTLSGMRPLDPGEPVCHVSFYEADAFARWKGENFANSRGARLPTEREWEHAVGELGDGGGETAFLESGLLHPAAVNEGRPDWCGSLWQWTSSYYEPYPGYRPFAGALAEYNGKFMDNQRVLRGGSCVTPRDHFRASYRNFWAAPTRFQFTGIRLARDGGV